MWKNVLIVTFFIFNSLAGLAQPPTNKYVIVTFEEKVTPSPHGIKQYNFITRVADLDLKNFRFQLAPMRMEIVSYGMQNRCINGDSISLADVPGDINVAPNGFYNRYDSLVVKLKSIIKGNKIKVQTISKEGLRSKHYVNVYVTPIEGDFCSCRGFRRNGGELFSAGKVFLPVSVKGYYGEFWNTKEAQLAKTNYSFINYYQARFDTVYGPYIDMEK